MRGWLLFEAVVKSPMPEARTPRCNFLGGRWGRV